LAKTINEHISKNAGKSFSFVDALYVAAKPATRCNPSRLSVRKGRTPEETVMCTRFSWRIISAAVLSLAAVPLLAESRTTLSDHVPKFTRHATDKGPANASSLIGVTVWLKAADRKALEEVVAAQQDPASPSYHRWLTQSQINDSQTPRSTDLVALSSFLSTHGLTVTGVGPHNMFVSARGSVALVQSTFETQIHNFVFNGRTYYANTSGPSLPSHLAPLVTAVGGLTNFGPRPMLIRRSDPDGGVIPLVRLGGTPSGAFFPADCFKAPETHTFAGKGIVATYTGNVYDQNCGYQPSDVYSAYDLNPLYRTGLDGKGETIAIVDAFGSITIQQDLDTFSAVYGLPSTKIAIYGKPTESSFSGDANSGWADETTLDVEWVHAIAPGANIALIVAPDNSDSNLYAGIAFASTLPGVAAISNSWLDFEYLTGQPSRAFGDFVLLTAVAEGISVNFSSGDGGDSSLPSGFALEGVVDVGYPASSPWATAIGGVSLALSSDHRMGFQSGWGTNLVRLTDTAANGNTPLDPPVPIGTVVLGLPNSFYYGSGGGASNFYAKPRFQRNLPGQRRMVPDLAWLADPYTGVEFIETIDAAGDQGVGVIGGTSLSCPMFSALWGIVTQAAGHLMGQASALVYNLDDDAITDIGPVDSRSDVTGTIADASGVTVWNKWGLPGPLQNSPPFYSALYRGTSSGRWYLVTFGTDSTLGTGPGWDDVTGLGTPNGWKFVKAVARR
jgi:subtilase family serine protease